MRRIRYMREDSLGPRIFSAGTMVVVATLCFSISQIGSTVTYFSDTEVSEANVLSAGILDFSVDPNNINVDINLLGGNVSIAQTVIPVPQSLPLEYKITAQKTHGADALCNALEATVSTPFVYSGSLLSISATSTTLTHWNVDMSLSSTAGLVVGQICGIDLVYRGLVVGENSGYKDEEKVRIIFHAIMSTTTEPEIILQLSSFESSGPVEEPVEEPAEELKEEPVIENEPESEPEATSTPEVIPEVIEEEEEEPQNVEEAVEEEEMVTEETQEVVDEPEAPSEVEEETPSEIVSE